MRTMTMTFGAVCLSMVNLGLVFSGQSDAQIDQGADSGIRLSNEVTDEKSQKAILKVPNDPKYLLLDSRIIASTEGTHLVLGTIEKDQRNPLFVEDKPWEPRFDNLYPNIIFDGQEELYKCWYNPFIIDPRTSSTARRREMGVCYATSKDGMVWEKPDLGIVEFDGSRKNNIVVRGPYGPGVWKDLSDPDPSRRYKMFLKNHSFLPDHMSVSFSPDGLHWSPPEACPEIEAKGDTHNNAFWAQHLNKYVGITRLWDKEKRVRIVGRTESVDFLKWTKAAEVFRALPTEAHRQTYAMPVFPYANVYLGLVMMFNTDDDTVDCELSWSPDTVHWERVCPGTPLIPRGAEGSYDSGCIYAAAYPITRNGKIMLYYNGSNGNHAGWRDGFFCLARLRPDGFAGLEPVKSDVVGTVATEPVECVGRNLQLSADALGGSLRVAIVDADGFGLGDCEPIDSNVTDGMVRWRNNRDLSEFLGKPIQFRFELRNARLYAFGFSDE